MGQLPRTILLPFLSGLIWCFPLSVVAKDSESAGIIGFIPDVFVPALKFGPVGVFLLIILITGQLFYTVIKLREETNSLDDERNSIRQIKLAERSRLLKYTAAFAIYASIVMACAYWFTLKSTSVPTASEANMHWVAIGDRFKGLIGSDQVAAQKGTETWNWGILARMSLRASLRNACDSLHIAIDDRHKGMEYYEEQLVLRGFFASKPDLPDKINRVRDATHFLEWGEPPVSNVNFGWAMGNVGTIIQDIDDLVAKKL